MANYGDLKKKTAAVNSQANLVLSKIWQASSVSAGSQCQRMNKGTDNKSCSILLKSDLTGNIIVVHPLEDDFVR